MDWSPPCEYVVDITRRNSNDAVIARTHYCVRHDTLTTTTDTPCHTD